MTELQELTVVSLVGKQPMPNLIINLEYLPKEAFFLYTSDVHDVLGNLKEILKPKGIQCHSVLVPHSPVTTHQSPFVLENQLHLPILRYTPKPANRISNLFRVGDILQNLQ
jgi:hypothetical protein